MEPIRTAAISFVLGWMLLWLAACGSDSTGDATDGAAEDAASDGPAGDDATVADADADADAGGSCPPDTCPSGMVYVPCGPFVMGTDPGEGGSDEQPKHTVALSAYCIDLTEVTNAQWRACVAAGGCTSPAGGTSSYTRSDYHTNAAYSEYPVVRVDWNQAVAYCAWAGKRLPTEAEWEKAARGGCEVVAPATCGAEDEPAYPWGDAAPTCALANYRDCVGDTDRVGARSPAGDGPYGERDMAGNAWEWVVDWYDVNGYDACASGCLDPVGPGSSPLGLRVVRGGGWYSITNHQRAAYRYRLDPSSGYGIVGLRCVGTPGA